MTEKKNRYFVSDVHLGAPALENNRERETMFAKWLDHIKDDVAELFLLGDIFDFWWDYKKVVPRGFTRILGRLADLADSGVKIHFFPGNHDLWAFDYFEEELGVRIEKEPMTINLEGKNFFLAHGDGLDANDKGYILLKKIFTNSTMQWLYSRLHPNFALFIAHRWSRSSRLAKINIDDKFDVKQEGMYKFAAEYLKKEDIDYFIFGHRHLLVNEPLEGNSRFVLLGDWIQYYSYGVFDGENFEIRNFR